LVWLGLILVMVGMWLAVATIQFVSRFQDRYISPTRKLVLAHAQQLGIASFPELGRPRVSSRSEVLEKFSIVLAALISLVPEFQIGMRPLFASGLVNCAILVLLLGMVTVSHKELERRRMETSEIIFPMPPSPTVAIKPPSPQIAALPVPTPPVSALPRPQPPRIKVPRVEALPRLPLPVLTEEAELHPLVASKPSVVLAPQPKPALPAAPTMLGDANGVKPNQGAQSSSIVAALGNPNGGSASSVPHGVVGSAGIGAGSRSSSGATTGKVASAGIAGMASATTEPRGTAPASSPPTTPPVLLSHAQPEYTTEAKQLKIQGDVVLRVRITESGEMVVLSVLRGLGHGLDEAATRSAPTYKFRPATKNGHPVDFTTNVFIKFQLD
jgi:TonB family protein